ncbi:hypothetical protein NUW58_g1943 [Xylaria curta]|uniref:Uncharacterized protein n=1 Tax=Xylaria curta TaxID=42375 RepID=A0ACC1PIX2_9PEZI|nr:hypothetical protein NUW58_g1943 [Xylaria curta]
MQKLAILTVLRAASCTALSSSLPQKDILGLHDAAVARGKLYFGTASDWWEFQHDEPYTKQLNNTHDFGQLTALATMKMDAIQPERGIFNFTGGDTLANLASANGQHLRCHSTVWHLSTPSWVTAGNFDNDTLVEILKDHINRTVSHYKGRCYAWDVVNEALDVNGGWRESVWYNTIGPAYLPIAFATAAQVDPGAKLYYNDFGIELPSPKATAAQNIVKLIKSYGVRIDGVGIQAHTDLSGMPPEAHFELGSSPSYDETVAVMKQFVALGVEVAITELDASIITPSNSASLAMQADAYYNFTAACLTVKECVGITIWDWTDKYTWVPSTFPDLGDALPWDKDFLKKPAYNGIMKAFETFKP